jgi:hypothetical protein
MSPRFALVVVLTLLASACRTTGEKSKTYADATLMQATDTKIVYIIYGGKRHQVPDPQTLGALSVSGQLPMQSHAAIAAVPEGEPVPHLPGRVIQKAGSGEVFMLHEGKRHWIPDPETLESLGVAQEVRGVPDSVADSIPLGSPLAHLSKSPAQPERSNK